MNIDEKDESSAEPTLDERRRTIVHRCLETLLREKPELYYEPTSEVARELRATLQRPAFLDDTEREAVMPLSVRDIERLLAYK